MDFSNRLKELRKEYNLTQAEVSQFAKMSSRQYQNLEYGVHNPSYDNLIALADFYNLSLDELVGREFPKAER